MESTGVWWIRWSLLESQWTSLVEKSGPNPESLPEHGIFPRTTLDWTCQFGLCDTEKVWVTGLVDSSRFRWTGLVQRSDRTSCARVMMIVWIYEHGLSMVSSRDTSCDSHVKAGEWPKATTPLVESDGIRQIMWGSVQSSIIKVGRRIVYLY